MIIFNRSGNSRYFTSLDTPVFIFTDETYTNKTFKLSDFYSKTPSIQSSFLVVISYTSVNLNDAALVKKLDDEINGLAGQNRSKLIWIDDFTKSDFSSSLSAIINNHNEILQLQLSKGRKFSVQVSPDDFEKAFLEYDTATDRILMKHENNGEFTFSANQGQSKHSVLSINLKKENIQPPGAVILPPGNFKDEISIQPVSMYVNKNLLALAEEPLATVNYFTNETFINRYQLNGLFYPFEIEKADAEKRIVSRFRMHPVDPHNVTKLVSNIADGRGHRLTADNMDDVTMEIHEVIPGKKEKRFVLGFTNESVLHLEQNDPGSAILLGYSGTESLQHPKQTLSLQFQATNKILVNPENNTITELGTEKVYTVPSLMETMTFNTDAEKGASFQNLAASVPDDKRKEVDYVPLKKGEMPHAKEMPFIPTHCFTGHPHLLPLEKVFSVNRLNIHTQSASPLTLDEKSPSYVTPQGFLRSPLNDPGFPGLNDQLDFIRTEPNPKPPKEIEENKDRKNLRFSIKIDVIDKDFIPSISKEDVFFVITPKLLKNTSYKTLFDIFFSLRGFDVDLLLNNLPSPALHSQQIIVFKYSRHTVNELLNDTTKWSNYDKYNQKSDLDTIASNLLADFKEFETRYNSTKAGPANDYFYIDQVVRRDANWNGVFIVNIPIVNPDLLPKVFTGLSGSQDLKSYPTPGTLTGEKLQFREGMKFQYIAFPVNRTFINSGKIEIRTTSFYGLIDYDLLRDIGKPDSDYKRVSDFYPPKASVTDNYKFLLTKLLVRFENNEIRNFKTFAFIQVKELFDNSITLDAIRLTHKDDNNAPGDMKDNLVRLEGFYQQNSAGQDEFSFSVKANLKIKFDDGNILDNIEVRRLSFGYSEGTDEYRFDIDAKADPGSWISFGTDNIMSIKGLEFQNIGLKFKLDGLKLPKINFDLSKLFVIPKIDFNGKGLLSSFPIKFSHFQNFKLKLSGSPGNFKLDFPENDFLNIRFKAPTIDLHLPKIDIPNLFSFIFDFDLGTLGNLAALKALKGQLLVGWSFKGGFALGFKLNGPSSQGLHIDLFNVLKLDIERLDLCKLGEQYILRLVNTKLKIINVTLPPDGDQFSALIFAKKGEKIAWLVTYVDVEKNKLSLGLGQRVGIGGLQGIKKVDEAIAKIREIFDPKRDICNSATFPEDVYKPDNNWLVASDNMIPESWKDVIDLKFIFNDPVLYGIFLKLVGLFEVDILYKKVSDNLGAWSLEFALDPSIRTIEMGAASVTFPNIGIDIYTNGDWKGDLGFPRGDDYSRSCLVQIRPFVGWGGFYVMKSRTASLTLFGGYITNEYSNANLNILQVGFALRIGIGAYIDKGIFYVGASISVYGILEGAFAFEKGGGGLSKFFPDHFAILGRVGAIAELIGYVDFKLIKASIHILLRVEVGMLLVYISRDGIPGGNTGKGLQPVNLYIEGRVSVSVDFTICCFRIFRKRICIVIHLSFSATVRFAYTLGGSSRGNNAAALDILALEQLPSIIIVDIKKVPVIYLPSFTKSKENGNERFHVIHHFAIPFMGVKVTDGKMKVSEDNILKDDIIKPLFTALLKELPADLRNYEILRTILLTGKLQNKEIELKFPDVRPTFIIGKDLDNPADDALQTIFKFKTANQAGENEVSLYRAANPACDTNPDTCPFRLIPVPISSKISVEEHSNGTVKSWQSNEGAGFRIAFNNIVTNQGNNNLQIDIKTSRDYSKTQVDQIEESFDDYKTQFLDRKRVNSLALDEPMFDIREDVMIPEYFKLIGLLTLEAYYFFESSKDGNRKKERFNPEISVTAITNVVSAENTWNLNDHIESIISQLNYYYNNGLRLPDVKSSTPSATRPYYVLTGQVSDFTAISNAPLNDVDISIINLASVTESTSLKKEMLEDEQGLIDFRKSIAEKINVNLSQLKNFSVPVLTPPFELIPVSLSIHNSKLNVSENAGRFFEMPVRIATHSNRKYTLNMKCSEREKEKNAVQIFPDKYIICTNVGLKARPYKISDKVRQVEILNVNIDDLELINKVRSETSFIDSIAIYLKTNTDKVSTLTPIIKTKARIIKTNLSPKTHPPVVDAGLLIAAAKNEQEKFWADSSGADIPEFVRLVWEGLTTNNGGYFIQFDNDDLFKIEEKMTECEIVISFETRKEIFDSFSNYIKITKDESLFKQLDENTHYLFIELFNDKKEPIKEFHSKLPVHCAAFSIERDKLAEELGHYLPLEFEVSEVKNGSSAVIISKEKILPLMPKDGPGNRIIYQHVSPLIKRDVKDPGNINRYTTVGHEYSITFAVRDTFGFRAIAADQELKFKQKYFDRLIPVESWPLLNLSYWFKAFKDGTDIITWDLHFTTNIFDILDMAGIERKQNKDYKYKPKDPITNDDMLKLNDALQPVLEKLHSIKAQLNDEKLTASITGMANTADSKKELINKVDAITAAIESLFNEQKPETFKKMPAVINHTSLGLEVRLSENLKDLAGVAIALIRPANLCSDIPKSEEIWEYDTIKSVSGKVILKNPGSASSSSLKTLNEIISTQSRGKYCLGISSDPNRNRIIFLVNTEHLKFPFDITINNEQDFYGIKPYSTALWSGDYEARRDDLPGVHRFSNIDLDSGLKVILAKIDELLSPASLLEMDIKEANSLLTSKKRLVENPSQPELSNKIELLAAVNPEPVKTEEFNNLLLDKLNNFYNFDGIIHQDEITSLSTLQNHRLTINFEDDPNPEVIKKYRLVSSKPDFRDLPKWSILFDYVGNNIDSSGNDLAEHNFELRPQVSHIEYEIKTMEGSGDIERSTWIQLVEPVKLKTLKVDKFPNIIRRYPPLLYIINSRAQQKVADTEDPQVVWSKSLGEWQYLLDINDDYSPGDKIHLELYLKKLNTGSPLVAEENIPRNFPGFIAFWSSDILSRESRLNDKKGRSLFISLFEDELKREPLKIDNIVSLNEENMSVRFILTKIPGDKWQTIALDAGLSLPPVISSAAGELHLEFSGSNILTNGIFSVKPEMYVTRNENQFIKNREFIYKTDKVTATHWTTPHITYNNVIRTPDGKDLQSVINDIPEASLPFKSTAKFILTVGDVKDNPPYIPVKQMEYDGAKPSAVDNEFKEYGDGTPAISLTLYNGNDKVNGLPVFHALTIFKS